MYQEITNFFQVFYPLSKNRYLPVFLVFVFVPPPLAVLSPYLYMTHAFPLLSLYRCHIPRPSSNVYLLLHFMLFYSTSRWAALATSALLQHRRNVVGYSSPDCYETNKYFLCVETVTRRFRSVAESIVFPIGAKLCRVPRPFRATPLRAVIMPTIKHPFAWGELNDDTYLLLHRLPLEVEEIDMESALSFRFTLPPTLTLPSITFTALRSRMPITDALVSLGEELVHRDVICIDVCFDLGEAPREERIQFEQACGIYFEGLERGSCCPLRRTPPCDNGMDAKFRIGSLCRLNLVKIRASDKGRIVCVSHTSFVIG